MEGIKVKYNFNGCIQNVKFNGRRLIRAAQALPRQPGVTVWGDVGSQCGVSLLLSKQAYAAFSLSFLDGSNVTGSFQLVVLM